MIYKVGGCVRDELLGIKSKDIDYVFVINSSDCSVEEGYAMMKEYLSLEGFEIFLETPEMFTIRARFPDKRETADFVLSRKEVGYVPDSRRPILELGSLEDDLFRRDFTVNAIAKDEKGNYIDPFGGLYDIHNRTLTTPNRNVEKTLDDDPLRILRAIRFHVTKGFAFSDSLWEAMRDYDYSKMKVVSEERIREELIKAFKMDSRKTLLILNRIPQLFHYIFDNTNLWLKPTNEQ